MIENRKTYPRIVERALRKCRRMYRDGVYAYCTPVEYVALCTYFGHSKKSIQQYYLDKVKKGYSASTSHYFKINKWDREYPVNECAMLDVLMDVNYPNS